MHPVDLVQITDYQILLTAFGSLIGATACGLVAFSFWLTWYRVHYKLILAQAIFFTTVAITQTIATITNFAYYVNPDQIIVVPLFEYRQILFTAAILFVLLRLWLRNNKIEKIMEVHQAVVQSEILRKK